MRGCDRPHAILLILFATVLRRRFRAPGLGADIAMWSTAQTDKGEKKKEKKEKKDKKAGAGGEETKSKINPKAFPLADAQLTVT